jgi:hypothetical protein
MMDWTANLAIAFEDHAMIMVVRTPDNLEDKYRSRMQLLEGGGEKIKDLIDGD